MTACVNKNHGRRVAGVVTASLVGALTLGGVSLAAVPTVALAEQGSLQAGDSALAFSNGKVAFNLSDGTNTIDNNNSEAAYSGDVFKLTSLSVTPTAGTVKENVLTSSKYKVYFVKADSKGKPTDEQVGSIVDAGKYCVVVEAVSGDWAGGKAVSDAFTVTGKSFATVTAYKANGKDTLGELTYNGEAQKVPVFKSSNGDTLTEGVDYTVKYFAPNSDLQDPDKGMDGVTDAGENGTTYTAVLTGTGAYKGSTAKVDVTVDPYTLAGDDVYIPVTVGKDQKIDLANATVNGSKALASHFKFEYVNGADTDNNGNADGLGGFDVKLSVKDPDNDKNVSGTATVKAYRVASGVTFKYGDQALSDGGSVSINLKDEDQANGFDVDEIKATYVDDKGKTQKIEAGNKGEAGKWAVSSVKDSTGADVSNNQDWVKTPGTYTVTLAATPDANSSFGGSVQFKVVVNNGSLDSDKQLFIAVDGKVTTSPEVTWDGNQVTVGTTNAKVLVKLVDADKNDVSTNLKFSFEKDGQKVSEVRDAGTYTVTVTTPDYELTNNTFTLTVKKLAVSEVRIATSDEAVSGNLGTAPTDTTTLTGQNGQYKLAHTGSDLTPAYVYTDGTRDDEGNVVWKYLKGSVADNYLDLSYTLNGSETKLVKDAGDYTVSFKASAAVDAKNVEVTAADYNFTVADSEQKFADVPSTYWGYEAIQKAASDGYKYINGVGNTGTFAPESYIKRADAVGILFNMAGGSSKFDEDEFRGEDGSYATGFSDVDGHAYYAQALAWAHKVGVANGYGDGTFAPESFISRQEFAGLLYNYAKVSGGDLTVGDATLDGTVSPWAETAVKWAVSHKVMGNGGYVDGGSNIKRAEVAAMAVNYQPAGALK